MAMRQPSRTAVYRRPWLYDKQRDAIFDPARYSVIEASTKAGKTVGCMVWLAEQAMAARPGQNAWWIAPVYGQAEIAFRRLRRGLPTDLCNANESKLTLTLANEAVLWFKSAEKPDGLYGEDVIAAVIDEASRCREESWYAVRSTLTATQGPVRIIGNVKGRKNWAYRLARRAEAGEPGMAYHRLVAADAVAAGIITAEEVEDARRNLPEQVFRELYEAVASDDGGNPFGLDAVRSRVAPLSSGEPAVWGWDLAKSVDWTVGVALDREGRCCRLLRFQRPWTETLETIRAETGRVPAWVDSTGVGDPIVEQLQRGSGRYTGVKFTAESKQRLMEGLSVAIQQGRITYPDGAVVSELEAFEYAYTRTGVRYAAPAGMHDDCVCALALAVQGSTRPNRGDAWTRAWSQMAPAA